ncbi:MAG: outer membrane protein assembly factor BamD [Deltaproteobacteria bacterium]|nr:outer membrane protein assembly factor BamD [Deltaproteobacteria bacterium]
MSTRAPRLAFPLLLVLLGPFACGGSARESGGRVEYSVSAQNNYERGMKKLEEEDWVEAAKYFSFVKARFPYSKFAVLAELRLADTSFQSGSYLEAIDAYKLFIKYHPTHEMVENGYAAFRVGESYYRTLPDDWFLVPPSYEKDSSATHDALRELSSFLRKYPQSRFVEKAKKLRDTCAKRLAAHEWYVAKFYWKKDEPMGTVLRLKALLDRYPGVGYDEEALWLLGKAYLRVNRSEDAKSTWKSLIKKYPSHRRAGDARNELTKLGG